MGIIWKLRKGDTHSCMGRVVCTECTFLSNYMKIPRKMSELWGVQECEFHKKKHKRQSKGYNSEQIKEKQP